LKIYLPQSMTAQFTTMRLKFGQTFLKLITAALNNIDVLKENKVKRLTIGYCTVYEVLEIDDTSPSATIELYEHQRTSSLSTSSGLMKQLMLSLSVQLINSKEEVTTFNE
uniref:Uncharacterized protein n=1 Tax=Amphimedon queenslandica TaxID=400682 RepID=A0A1X7SL67_AMPQE